MVLGPVEPGTERGDEQQVQQTVQNGLLTGLVAPQLLRDQGEERTVAVALRDDEDIRESVQEAVADPGPALVGTADQQGRARLAGPAGPRVEGRPPATARAVRAQ
ncbi:hypothetical protein GCM10020295_11720 [Streptomyces cinereospinus]